ncbi:hypothetical protein LguiA_000693 [Lonicera macranthoides]
MRRQRDKRKQGERDRESRPGRVQRSLDSNVSFAHSIYLYIYKLYLQPQSVINLILC